MKNSKDQDVIVMESLVVVWNNFIKLKHTHPDDVPDFRRAIHECQRIMATRQLRRVDPGKWLTKSI